MSTGRGNRKGTGVAQSAAGIRDIMSGLTERKAPATEEPVVESVVEESGSSILEEAARRAGQIVDEATRMADGILNKAEERAREILRDSERELSDAVRQREAVREEADRILSEARKEAERIKNEAVESMDGFEYLQYQIREQRKKQLGSVFFLQQSS